MGSATQPDGSDAALTRTDHDAPDIHPGDSSVVVVPVVLPHALVTVDETGHARITIENTNHQATGCPDEPVGRDELGAVLARIAEQIGGPIRVEVREPDGSRYADILQPHPPQPRPDTEHRSDESDEGPLLRGEGFSPGETVLVAVVITTTQARPDGTASLASLRLPARSGGEIILFGGASGRVVQRQVPVRPRFRGRRWRR